MASLEPPPRPHAAALLRSLALAPAAPTVVAIGWLGLALTASQLPAFDSAVTDGLTHADLLALAGLGLDRLFASVPVLLWVGVTLIVVGARLLEPANRRGVLATDAPQAMLQPWTPRVSDDRIELGRLGLGRGLLAAAAVSALVAWAVAARAPQAVWLELTPDQPAARLDAWQVDAGTRAAAPGRWFGNCRRRGVEPARQLDCDLETPEGPLHVQLAPGTRQGAVGWSARATGTMGGELLLDWRSASGPVRLRLEPGKPGQSAALHLQVWPVATETAGPLVLTLRDAGDLRLLAPPALAPVGSPLRAQLAGPEVVRLQWRPTSVAPWLWLVAWALLLPGALWAWLVPGVVLRRTDTGWRLLACNRAALRRRLEQTP